MAGTERVADEPSKGFMVGLRGFLVGLTGTDGRDVKCWAEALVPILLFGMVLTNALVAFGSWWLASKAFFSTSLDENGRMGMGQIGGLLIGFIDWMVVSYHPSLPVWFVAGQDPPSAKAVKIVNGQVIPLMPTGWAYWKPYLVRMVLAGVIAIVIGTGVSVAANMTTVVARRQADALIQTINDANVDYRTKVQARTDALTAQSVWKENHPDFDQQLKVAQTAYDSARQDQKEIEQRIKCESPQDNPLQKEGVCKSAPSWTGWRRAVQDRDLYKTNVETTQATLNALVAKQDEVKVPAVPEPVTVKEPNPAYTEGLGPTLSAYFGMASSWPWYIEWGAFLAMLAFDLTPVVFKAFRGFPITDERAWIREATEIFDRLAQAREQRLSGARGEVDLRRHTNMLRVVDAEGEDAVVTARESARTARQEQVENARLAARARRDDDVRGAQEEARLEAEARIRAATARAYAAQEEARLEAEARIREATARADRSRHQRGPDQEPDSAQDGQQAPPQPEGDRAEDPGSPRREQTSGAAHDDDSTPQEAQPPPTSSSRSQEHAPWTAAARYPADEVWTDQAGNDYLFGPFLSENARNESRNDVRLAIRIPPRGGEEVPLGELVARHCRVIKFLGTRPAYDGESLRSGQYFTDPAPAGALNQSGKWVSQYYPRADLERCLSAYRRQKLPLTYLKVADWGRDLLGDLSRLHERGLAHNDVKASNTVIEGAMHPDSTQLDGKSGALVLIDFDSVTPLSDVNSVGSYTWLAPERARDGRPTIEADIFSAAAVMLYMVTGERVNQFVAGVPAARVQEHATSPGWYGRFADAWKLRLPELMTDVPDALRELILRGVHPERSERPSLREFEDALRHLPLDRLDKEFYPRGGARLPVGLNSQVMSLVTELGYVIEK